MWGCRKRQHALRQQHKLYSAANARIAVQQQHTMKQRNMRNINSWIGRHSIVYARACLL
jgi:hypothetical protein